MMRETAVQIGNSTEEPFEKGLATPSVQSFALGFLRVHGESYIRA